MNREHKANYDITLDKLSQLEKAYGHKLIITSGYRTLEHHLAIYKAKGITDKAKIPMKSRHLSGEAVDVVPKDKPVSHLHEWVESNVSELEKIGFWCEALPFTSNWLHLQTCPPKSGKRFFIP